MKLARIVLAGAVMLPANGGAEAESGAKPFYLEEATISDVHAAYKSGAITATRLVQAYLDRIKAYDQAGPKLNVVIFLNPKANRQSTPILPTATRPSNRWRRSFPLASSIRISGKTSRKHKASNWTTATACGYRSAPSCSSAS